MIEKNKKRIIHLLTIAVLLFSYSGIWAQQTCESMPEPVAYTRIGTPSNTSVKEYADVRGVRVTRTMTTRGNPGDRIAYSNEDNAPAEFYCGKDRKTAFGNKKYPFMDSNKVFKIVYEFSKPVNDVEVFFAAFGYIGTRDWWKRDKLHQDIVEFSLGNADGSTYAGEMQLILRSDCTGGVAIISGGTVSSEDKKITDAKIGVTSSTPFTKLVLDYKEPPGQSGGYGFFPEICLASVVTPINQSSCTPPTIADPFSTFPIDTKTINGISVKRTVDSGIGASGSFPGSHCGGTQITYPSKDPLLGNSKKIVYEFGAPIKSAEIFLLAFGDNKAITTFDKTQFEVDGGGTISLSKTYDCNPIASSITGNVVSSVDNRKLTTDVAIKVSSDKPFSKITITDKASTGHGYLVALCPSSVTKATDSDLIVLDAGVSTLTNQTVCDTQAPIYKAKASAGAFASTATFDYELQVLRAPGTWTKVEEKKGVSSGTVYTFPAAALKSATYNGSQIRVKYTYKNSLFPSVTGTAYSNVVTLTVKETASISSLIASPTSLNETGATNIVYTIKGTPGATVTYRVTGDAADKTIVLHNTTGEATVPVNNRTSNTILTITKVEKTGLCSRENLHYKAEVDHQGSTCTSHPTPQFAKGNNTKATFNGVEVTRTLEGNPNYFPTQTYLAQYNLCTPTLIDGHPAMNEHGFNKVTYTFAKPITKIQVWLSGFGSTEPNKLDEAEFSIDCADANLSLSVTDCNNTAEANLVTKSGGRITSNSTKYFQAIVQVTADKPFTKLEVKKGTVKGFQGYGYVVELCPTSLNPAKIKVTQNPTNVTACVGATGKRFTAKAKIEGIAATESMSYTWQQTKTPAVASSWVTAVAPSPSGSVRVDASTEAGLTLNAIQASDNGLYYRAAFTFTKCGHTLETVYSEPAKLIVPSDSDIITIVATQPSNVTTSDCTQTTNVSAQAKIADGYNIKNVPARGGNIFGYYLEFKDTDNTWKTYKGQQYSNNPSNHPQTLKIVHRDAPTGTTSFRVRYTVELTIGCEYTVTSNEFTFTKNLPAEPGITTPQTFCQAENKTLAGLTTLANIKWYNAATGGAEVLVSTTIPAGTQNYWATVTTNGCESTRKQVTVTIVAKPNAPTVQTKTECPATGNYDMRNLVTSAVPTGHTLKWYAAATGTATASSLVDRNQTAKTTYERWVALVTPQGCESDRVKATYIVDITTPPTITAPASNLTINCADPAATVTSQVNTWLGTATATVGCGTPTITNNYATVKPADLCSVGEIEVTFTVRDAFGTQKTVNKKIMVDRLIANNDTESVARSTGKDIDVLANDTKNGQPATKDNVKVQIVNANSTGATVTPDGKIRIPDGTLTPGLHNITYKICDKDNPSRCGATATIAVTITNSTIEANNDTPAPLTYATSVAYVKNTDGTELNVLANDKLSGVTPNLSQVTIIPVATASGVSIEPATGKVKVNASTPAGVYNLTYKIRENGTTNESNVATVAVVVKNALNATPATLITPITPSTSATTPKVVGDVLDQTTLNGSKPNLSQVTISVTQGANPPVAGDPVPTINTTTGKVEIPSGVKPGPYTIKYKVCDKATGVAQTCKDVTLPITVTGGNTIVAQNDDLSANKVERSSSEEVVKNGTTPINVLANDKLGDRTGLDNSVVTITQTSPATAVNIDTVTGQIKLAANTPAGVYEVKYKITEKGQTTASNEATAKVVVTNKVELDPAAIPLTVNPPTDSTPKTIANVLDKAKINGNVPTIGDATVEVVTPAPAAPGEIVPYIDPATGNVIVPSGTKVGNHQITYKVCDKVTPAVAKTCKTTTITIPVTGNTPTAVADDFSAHKVERPSTDKFVNNGTNDLNVLTNDALGSNTNITTALVTINQTDTTNSGVNIDTATGKVKVSANTPAGEYTVKYTLTEKGGTTPSAEVTVKVVVTNKLELGPGNIPSSVKPATGNTPVEIGDVLDGTKLNGTPTTVGTAPNQVTIAVVTPATPQGSNPVPTLDPATGKVKIPAGVPAGPYTIKYKICDNATPASAKSCEEKTLNINVAGNNLTPIADDYFSGFKVEKPAAEVTVKNASSQEVNVLSNDKLGDRTGLDTNVVTINQTYTSDTSVNIDLATGKVKVGPGATAGEHVIRYALKEKGQSTESAQVTVKVTVTNKVEVTPATIPASVTPSTDTTTPEEIGNVLNQTKINGNTPTPAQVTITETVPAPKGNPSDKIPYIDPTTGKVLVPAGVKPGNYPITYKVCDKAPGAANTCKTATITVKVAGNTITSDDDNFSAHKMEHPTVDTFVTDGTNPVNVLTNDKLGTRTGLTTDLVTITPTVTNPNVTIDTDSGKVKVKANAPAGVYTVKYKITEKGQPTSAASAEKTVTVVVTNKLVNNDGNYGGAPSTTSTPADGGNVLDNVRINGATTNPAPSDVTITVNQTAGSGIVPYLEISGPDKGKIKLPQGTPSGTYTIKYTVCDNAPAAAKSCKQATATIVVNANAIVSQNDINNKDVEFNANTAQNVKRANNSDLNVLDNDKLGATTGLNNTQVTIQTTQSEANITIQPDGKVQVAAGKVAGVYELKYKIKDNANPTNISQEATVKVVVKNKLTFDPFPTTPVKPSTDNNTPADRINVLDKTKLNGNTPAISDVTIEVTDPADPQEPGDVVPELDPVTGKIKVPAGVKPGSYTIQYKVCDKVAGEAKTCKTNSITFTVAGNDILAVADDFTAHKVERSNTDKFVKNGTNDVNVLANDKLDTHTGLTKDLVTITQTHTSEPKVKIESDGRVKVEANAPAGTHTVKYTITEKGQTIVSNEVEVKVVVTNKIELDHTAVIHNPVTPSTDSTTPKVIGDVLDGTKLNGTKPTIGTGPNQVSITVTNPATPPVAGDPVPELDTTTGKVKIPAGVKPGDYNITYKVCDNATPQTCETTTITVKVEGNTTTAVADDFTAHKVEHPTANTFVNDGTNDVNVLSNDKLGNNSNISTNEVTITQTATSDPKVSIDTATGKVKVAANTPAGEYTVKYKFTEKGQPATKASEEKEVKVLVTNKLVNNNANYGGAPSTNSTPANGGNVLDNVRINDAPSNPVPNDVTITVDTPATGTIVPYLETSGPDAGKIKIPQGTPSGIYTIKYTVYDKAPGAAKSYKQATANITVGTNAIIAENDITNIKAAEYNANAAQNVKKTDGTNLNVLDNDTLAGVPGLNTTQVTIETIAAADGITIKPSGEVEIAAGKQAGVYERKYKIKDKINPTNISGEATVKVVVKNKVVSNDALYAGKPSTNTTPRPVGDVLDNVRINGSPTAPQPDDLTITVVTPAAGAIVPSLITTGPNAGKIVVPKGTPVDTYTIVYKVCDKATGEAQTCKQNVANVTVTGNDIVANPTTKRLPKTGGSVNVLDNTTIGGDPAHKDNVDISITNDGRTGATVDPTTGKIVVPNGLIPGTHAINYKVCEKGSSINCQTSTLKVVIPDNIVVDSTPDAVVPKTGGTADVLNNTTVNGDPATKEKVDVSIVNDGGTRATVDPNTGKIRIPDGQTPGTHIITYKVCEKGQTDNCETATLKVIVPADIVLNRDEDKTVPKTGGTIDVLGNDTINGNPATKDNVDISIVDPNGTNATIDPTGKIVIPNGATPGTYTIQYKVCEKGTYRCEQSSVKVVVVQENIVANVDSYQQQWSATETVAKDANRDANILTNDSWESNTELNTNLVDIEQVEASSDKVSIDTATGKVKIAAGAPAGTYTLKYTIKPKGQATPISAPATVTVVVKNKVEVTDNEISGTPSDNNSPREIGNVTDNVKINGQKPNPSDVAIEEINQATPLRPGAPVPTVDPTTGNIIVDKDVPTGEYSIKVRVCDKATPATCVEKVIPIRVKPNQTLQAENDEYTLGYTTKVGVTTGGSVLENDKLADKIGLSTNDVTVDTALRKATGVVDNDLVIMNEDGVITVKPGLAVGTYTYYYTIRTKDNTQTSEAKVVIHIAKYVAADDTIIAERPSKEGEEASSDISVLDNDRFNGEKPKPEDVDITVISTLPEGIELDTSTGKIKVKTGASIGEHTLRYRVCPKGSTNDCQEGEAKVKVQPNLTLKNHTFDKPINSALSETHTDSVLKDGTLDGQPIKSSDVTIEILDKGGIEGVTINADGQVVIPKGAPSGTYTVEYEVTSKEYGVKKIAKVTVTINNDATLEFYNAISTDEGSQNNGFIIKNIDLYPNNNLKIFNRYGVLVYEKDGYTNADPFKGFSTGRATVNKDGKLPQGTYYYVLEYTDGQNQSQQKAGWLYIK